MKEDLKFLENLEKMDLDGQSMKETVNKANK